MADDSIASSRSRRARPDRSGRLAALEKFKAVKSGQKKGYDVVDDEKDIYEEVTEEEYNRRVNDRRTDFVVGGGDDYKDDGYEIFDEEFEQKEREQSNKKKVSYKAPKSAQEKRQEAKKSGNIRSMFLSAPHKRKAETASLDDDDVLASIMKAKGLDVDDDDLPVKAGSSGGAVKRQRNEHAHPVNPFAKKDQTSKQNEPVKASSTTGSAEPKDSQVKSKAVILGSHCDNGNLLSKSTESVTLVTKDEPPTKTTAETTETNVKTEPLSVPPQETIDEDTIPPPPADRTQKMFKVEDVIAEADFDTDPEESSAIQASVPTDLPLLEHSSGEKIFRMFWFDAYEDPDVYNEVCAVLKQYGIKEFKCKNTVKKYVFYTKSVPRETSYLEVKYNPCKASNALPADLTGRTFFRVFGASTSSLESLILDRKLKGPSWLNVKAPKQAAVKRTTCRFEVDCPDLSNLSLSEIQSDPPNLTILTLQARVVRDGRSAKDEVVMVSGLVNGAYPLTKPPPARQFTGHFCLVAACADRNLPYDFKKELNTSAVAPLHIKACDNERMLISQLNAKVAKVDPDIIVGHDVNTFTLPAILATMERHKIYKPSAMSRLHRSSMINIARLDRAQLLPGRVLCDTKLSARELIQAKSYDLADLVQSVLSRQHDEIPIDAVREMYTRTDSLLQLCKHLMAESRFVLQLMAELNVLPLAAQITNICGNTLTQTLQKGRALRNEYLLLHAFAEKNFIEKDEFKDEKKRGPAYSGGLVLDPIVGFYDSMILLMDFNSLYPSIIQEYNLCFTTCALTPPEDAPTSPEADWEAQIPQATVDVGVLPLEIKKLVDSRRAVKTLLKKPNLSKEKLLQYDIRQKALKLTANSMYGCLGFQGSRFYAKPIAALITQRGRDILMSAKSLAESMGYTIIYGDTDSIMIKTGTNKVQQVHEIGNRIRQAINKQYRQLEIEVDGVFRAMLLLKKKKYAACTLSFGPDGAVTSQKIEVKGLDIVRRDWAELARCAGRFVIDTLLDGKLGTDDAVEAVHAHLRQVAAQVNDATLPLEQYIITKQLTKNVEDYTDANNQSHVIVAKRFNSRGARKLRAGDTVPYVVCADGTDLPHTQRAYHKDELEMKEYAGKLTIDKMYYLSQQVFPVVSRLVDPIQGTDMAVVAQCLGLDPSKYNRRAAFDPSETVDSELNVGISLLLPQSLDSDLFQNVEPFSVECVQCNAPISVDGPIFKMVDGQLQFLFAQCGRCQAQLSGHIEQLANQVTRRLQKLQSQAEDVTYVCQLCDYHQRDVLCNVHEEEIPTCAACGEDTLQLRAQQFQSYAQLKYWKFIFDLDTYAGKFPEAEFLKMVESDAVRIICSVFMDLIDTFLRDNGFTTFSLQSYMEKLPSCGFTRRPLVRPDLDIP
ncbi:DNA polymerase alpha catalytic subunit-like [Tropilaelaps mercedesae]|uniref:DNA polymerase n=1 Tax=Tropilaelaps mercedesae TaxID=418985 RepID=A0A1V9X7T7_9ACAR|nr:DNA polymerase alpha catalytic subunit-like [Tropilaelaps mercedesae]